MEGSSFSTECILGITGTDYRQRGIAMGSPEMVSIVHRAIDRERDAINVYLGLAKIVTDVKAKNVLIHLASDEVAHMAKLEKHLISVLRGKDWVIERADLVEAMSEQVSQPSLIEKLDTKALAKADTIRILGVAIDREIEAERFYVEMAGRSKKDSAREMFLSLAKEEELHAKVLRAEVDSIGQNGFWCDMQEFTMEQ
jgi:rubrerythrin